MGAVRNLFVRIGGDASGGVNTFRKVSTAAGNTKESVKQSTAQIRKSIRESFASAVPSIKEYTATVSRTKEAHQAAVQNIGRLSDQIAQLENVYGTIKNATDGLNLSKSLGDQIAETEKQLDAINAKIHKTQTAISRIGAPRSAGKAERLESLQEELRGLMVESDETAAHLRALDQAAERVGPDNMGLASAKGLGQLQQKITQTRNELQTTKMVAQETGQKLKDLRVMPTIGRALKGIGSAAGQAAKSGAQRLWERLKSLGSSAARGITALPGKLRDIGKGASAGCGGLGKMVKSIRNIGLVSLGLRVASGMFGRLRSIISEYISQNEALNASVTAMKTQLGEALAPAINLVLQAMQRLMPVVTAVSNAVSAVFSALFGKVSATGKAITASAEAAGAAADSLSTYGFDQITKETDTASGGGSSAGTDMTAQLAEQSALVQKLTAWIAQLKAAFMAGDWAGIGSIIADTVNKAVDAVAKVDVGTKVGEFANNLFTTLHSTVTGIDFMGIGATVGQKLTDAFRAINWNTVGETVGGALLALPSILVGFVFNTDWGTVSGSISQMLTSALNTVTNWLRSIDWLQLGPCISDMIAGVDWAGLATSLFTCLGTALMSMLSGLWSVIEEVVHRISDYFSGKIDAAGGNVAQGLLNGFVDGVRSGWGWVSQNVIQPFVSCFDGLANWFNTAIATPLKNAFTGIKTMGVQAFQGLWSGVRGWLNKLIGGAESAVNGVIKGINGLIRSFNKIASVGSYFGLNLSISTLGTVSLPRLARGTVVDEPTAAIVGEAGKEAVMPLENHTGWIADLAKQINQQGGGKAQSLAFAFYFRSRKLAEYVIADVNQITRETGTCPIYI